MAACLMHRREEPCHLCVCEDIAESMEDEGHDRVFVDTRWVPVREALREVLAAERAHVIGLVEAALRGARELAKYEEHLAEEDRSMSSHTIAEGRRRALRDLLVMLRGAECGSPAQPVPLSLERAP